MYAKFIDCVRKLVVVVFGFAGIGMVVCANHWLYLSPLIEDVFSYIVVACLILAFGLFFEYVVRSFLEVRPKGLAKYQFSLLEALVGVTFFAVLLSCYKILGAAFWPLVVPAVVIFACIVETCRRRSAAESKEPPADVATPPLDSPSGTTSGPKSTKGVVECRASAGKAALAPIERFVSPFAPLK